MSKVFFKSGSGTEASGSIVVGPHFTFTIKRRKKISQTSRHDDERVRHAKIPKRTSTQPTKEVKEEPLKNSLEKTKNNQPQRISWCRS